MREEWVIFLLPGSLMDMRIKIQAYLYNYINECFQEKNNLKFLFCLKAETINTINTIFLKLREISTGRQCLLFLSLTPLSYQVHKQILLLHLFSSPRFCWCMALNPFPLTPPFSFITLSALTAQTVGLQEKKPSLHIIATCGKMRPFGNTVIYMLQ